MRKNIIFLKKFLKDEKIIGLLKNGYFHEFLDFLDDCEYKLKIVKKIKVKNVKNFNDLHQEFLKLKEIEGISNYPLNPREDFLLLDNKIINVNDMDMVVKIPKERKDLIIFGQLFRNCVGRIENYAQRMSLGQSTILGIFDINNKPLYCIETGRYSFKQAKAISNINIDKDIRNELENLITIKPSIPSDFIKINHFFIFGYKYDSEKQSLYIMFKKNFYIYEYFNVGIDVYEKFNKIKNKGQFLNNQIKGNYVFEKMAS